MEVHGIHPAVGRKEITCSDCGHLYVIAQGQHSGRCQLCGNIEFLSNNVAVENQRSAPILDPVSDRELQAFHRNVSGERVEEIRMRYQVEWQLWAALVKQFDDPVLHFAYLTQSAVAGELDRAAERYREHRSVMTLLADSRWQAEVADLMLARVENIAVSRMAAQKVGHRFVLPEWVLLAPFQGNAVRVMWIAFGLIVIARLLHLHP